MTYNILPYRFLKDLEVVEIILSGELNFINASSISCTYKEFIDFYGFNHIIYNCLDTTKLNSATIGAIINSLTELKKHNYECVIISNKIVLKVFTLLGINNMFFIVDSKEKAYEFIKNIKYKNEYETKGDNLNVIESCL